ncbi:MAG: hypothetical protein IIA14_09060 [SAR324 cluster bacterium]|nr:hypothetical protein [SAR324 cluster bacterium]
MKREKKFNSTLGTLFKDLLDGFVVFLDWTLSLLRINTEKTRQQVEQIFRVTSGQVREKAEETRQAVRLRMATLELEHHLNRLYPQIGKIVCDLADDGKKMLLSDQELKTRIEMAAEYRQRLNALRDEQEAHYKRHKKEN